MTDNKGAVLPLIVIAAMRARPGMKPALGQALDALVTATRGEAGCIRYDLHQGLDDQDLFVMYEVWANKADHDTHSNSPHLRAFSQASRDLLDGEMRIDRLTPLQPGEDSR